MAVEVSQNKTTDGTVNFRDVAVLSVEYCWRCLVQVYGFVYFLSKIFFVEINFMKSILCPWPFTSNFVDFIRFWLIYPRFQPLS